PTRRSADLAHPPPVDAAYAHRPPGEDRPSRERHPGQAGAEDGACPEEQGAVVAQPEDLATCVAHGPQHESPADRDDLPHDVDAEAPAKEDRPVRGEAHRL